MKKIVAIMIAAFAAVLFTSCQKEIANNSSDNTIRMRIHASSSTIDTKTVVSENQQGFYDINWSAGDQIKVLEFADEQFTQAVSSDALASGSSEATFEVSLVEAEGNSFLYETVYPAGAYSKSSGDTPFYRLSIPDAQKYSVSSFDGDADVLISRPFQNNAQPEELVLEYKRVGSAARMVLKGITAGETINKITFSTEEGYIAGYSKFDPTNAEFLGTYSASKKLIELTPASATNATGEDVVWFRLYAITLKDNFKVVVTTDAATYTKEVDLATANRELAFYDGGLTKFNVAFTAENRKANSTTQYVLVTDASSLSAGDIIRIGCAANGKVAGVMNNNYLTSVAAEFSNGVMTSNDAVDISLGGSEGAWTLITSEGQITTSAAKALKLNTGAEKTWAISISESGTASITAGSYGAIQYNSGSPRFVNYTTAQTSIEIYKLNDGKQGQALSFGNETEFTATFGEEFTAPALSGNKTDVTYTSSNTAVAEVNETTGAISIVRTGTAVITAFAQEDDTYRYAYAIYFLNVQDPKYTITISEDISNGKVKADKTEAPEGAKVNLTATPDTGYQFDSWSVKDASGEDVEVLNNSFTMPASNVTVSASFIQSEGSGQIIDSYVLTSSDIKAAHAEAWGYTSGTKIITAADGSQWTANNTYANKEQVTIQMNKGKKSYILTPVAPSGKAISHLVVTCATSSTGETTSGVTRTFDITDASTGYAVATNIEGDNLTAGIDVSGSYTQLKIAPNETNGGACYIVNITVKLN